MSFFRDIDPEALRNFKDIVNIVLWSISICGGFYGLFKFAKNVNANNKERKIERFQNRVAQIDRVRSTSIKNCIDFYQKQYNEKIAPNKSLIIEKTWLLDDDQMLDFTKIKVKNEPFDYHHIKFPKLEIFPDKNMTYADLLIKHSHSQKVFFNGDIYCTYNIERNVDGFTIKTYKSNYYNFVNSCKVLELMTETDQAYLRKKIDVLDFQNRHSCIGISAITIFNNVFDENGERISYFALHQRSDAVVESPNLVHVVPAGTYSPMVSLQDFQNGKDHNEKSIEEQFDLDLRNTIYREFLEEVWQSKYMKELGSIKLLHENTKYYILKYFTKVYFLGLGIEPYNTKTEILAALIFDMKGFSDSKIDQIISNIKEDIDDNLKAQIKIEVKRLFKRQFSHEDFPAFFANDDCDNNYNEGKIRTEKLTKGILEQYYTDINATPSAKEIFRKVYHLIDKLQK